MAEDQPRHLPESTPPQPLQIPELKTQAEVNAQTIAQQEPALVEGDAQALADYHNAVTTAEPAVHVQDTHEVAPMTQPLFSGEVTTRHAQDNEVAARSPLASSLELTDAAEKDEDPQTFWDRARRLAKNFRHSGGS